MSPALKRMLLSLSPLLGTLALGCVVGFALGDWHLLVGLLLSLGTNLMTICWIEAHPQLWVPPFTRRAPPPASRRR